MCAHACRTQRPTVGIILRMLSISFETWSLIDLELITYTRLAHQQAPGIFLSMYLQNCDYKL